MIATWFDIGWYPDFNPNGKFMLLVIKNYDWHRPLFKRRSRSYYATKKIYNERLILCHEGLTQIINLKKQSFLKNKK